MATYRVQAKIKVVTYIKVEAANKEEALGKVANGEGDEIPGSEEFLEFLGPTGRVWLLK